MNNILQKLINVTQMRYMRILTSGFMGIASITIAGSIFTLIKSLPIDPWQSFLVSSGLDVILSIPVAITTDLMALYLVLSMGYTLAKSFDKNPFAAAVIALGAFMILTPFTATTYAPDASGKMIATITNNVISLSSVGSQGIFLAILCGLSASRLYVFCMDHGLHLKMPDSVPSNVTQMFESMIPGGLVFLLFLGIRWGVGLTQFQTAQNLVYGLLQQPLTKVGGGLGGLIIYLLVVKFFWLFGVHGGMVAYAAMAPIISAASTENLSAFAAGKPAPNPEWALMGLVAGIGILALTILMLFAKSEQFKSLGKIALPTSIFNITEPIMFGTPIIMNPLLAIPFIASPILSLLASMAVMDLGLVAMPTGASINNFIPVPILGSLLNSSWTGFVWGCVLILLNIVLYYPFFKIADKRNLLDELKAKETTIA